MNCAWLHVHPLLSQLLKHKADVNFVNEHGNTAMHYACFWQFEDCAEDLLECGALVSIENKYGESPVDKAPGRLAKRLMGKQFGYRLYMLLRHQLLKLSSFLVTVAHFQIPNGVTVKGKNCN